MLQQALLVERNATLRSRAARAQLPLHNSHNSDKPKYL
jgi:hypothetical protein